MTELYECARDGCVNLFEKMVHNQRFCSTECTREDTNRRALERYHARKNKAVKGRVCTVCNCDTVLSVYNPGDMCAYHENVAYIVKVRAMGWEVDEYGSIEY